MNEPVTSASSPCLSKQEGLAALSLARLAVTEAVLYRRFPEQIPGSGPFTEKRGLFVTLCVNGKLRGCIGVIEPEDSLAETLVKCAVSAALEDSRFPPLGVEELPGLAIEISLLSPLAPMRAEEIEIGRHGLLITRDYCRGVLLPQVAVKHCLDREQFLAETCHKAGLHRDAWRDAKTCIYGFTAEILSETEDAPLALRGRP